MGVLEAELVSQPRGFFVVFAGDRLAQLGPQPEPLSRARAVRCHVPGGAVVPLTKGSSPRAKTQ